MTADLIFYRFSLVAEIFLLTSSELYFDFPKGNPGPTTQCENRLLVAPVETHFSNIFFNLRCDIFEIVAIGGNNIFVLFQSILHTAFECSGKVAYFNNKRR